MRLMMLTNQREFLNVKAVAGAHKTPRAQVKAQESAGDNRAECNNPDNDNAVRGAIWHTKGFRFEAILRDKMADQLIAPRFGITVSNHTVKRLLVEKQYSATKLAQSPVTPGKMTKRKMEQKRGPVSVYRNRMRRRLREALREIAPKFARDGFDYVIIGRPALEALSFEFILKDLEKSFQKVHRRIISSDKHRAS